METIGIFEKGGLTYEGLTKAQEFFEKYVRNVEDIDKAILWMAEELGEAAYIIRNNDKSRYLDAVGDIVMWTITLARLLDLNVADALSFSIKELQRKGYMSDLG